MGKIHFWIHKNVEESLFLARSGIGFWNTNRCHLQAQRDWSHRESVDSIDSHLKSVEISCSPECRNKQWYPFFDIHNGRLLESI